MRLIIWCLLMCEAYSEDFWDHAMRTHYEQRVSLFNSLEVKDDALIMLGNSITASCNWSELFNNDKIINRGIGGDTTEGILKRIDFLKNCNPDAVFLLIGANDLSQGKTPDEIISNYGKIINVENNSILAMLNIELAENIINEQQKIKTNDGLVLEFIV